MKQMLLVILLLPALAFAQIRRPPAPMPERSQTVRAPLALQQVFAAYLRKKLKGESEDPAQRKIVYGDIDGDKVQDAVVQYTSEQVRGNGWGQSLAVFLCKKGVYQLAADDVVGGKFFRGFEVLNIAGREVIGQTQTCPGTDVQVICDNPRKQTVKYVLIGTTLREK